MKKKIYLFVETLKSMGVGVFLLNKRRTKNRDLNSTKKKCI